MEFTNSPLVSYTRISPNKSVNRTHAIDTITIHCVVGQVSAERLGSIFAPTSKSASSNYGVGYDGRIGMYVEEKDRSWCSSNIENDNRAITIEVASDTTRPYAVTDAAYAGMLDLVTDICKRNGIKKLLWKADKSLVGQVDKQNMTVHRWFAAKSCPGDYLYERHGAIAEEVNRRLAACGEEEKPAAGTDSSEKRELQVGDIVKITGKTYYTGKEVPSWVLAKNWIVYSASGDRVVVNKSEDGKNAIMSPFRASDLVLANEEEKPAEQSAPVTTISGVVSTGSDADMQRFHDFFMEKIGNEFGVAGLWGNIRAESAGRSNNLQNSFESKLGFTDETYTAAVDNGSYTNFVHDSAGYGLAQWTYWSRKQGMIDFAKAANKSIGDYETQLAFLDKELSRHTAVMSALKNAKSVKEASDVVLLDYEKPRDTSDNAKNTRAGYGQAFYDKFAGTSGSGDGEAPAADGKCTASAVIAVAQKEVGYYEKATNANLDDQTANKGSGNYTKYSRDFDTVYPNWYNGKKNGAAWCDIFVDWCFLTAFGYAKAMELLCQKEKSSGAGCKYSLRYFNAKGQFYTKGPKPGDQIFFGSSTEDVAHTGLVEKVDDKYVYTIEGNVSDMVDRRRYSLNDSGIVGYGRANFDPDSEVAPMPQPPEPRHTYGYVLKEGSSGVYVKAMQDKLGKLGYGTLADFGGTTLEAVKKFQRDNSLQVDGEAGEETLGKIDELFSKMGG